MAQSSSSSSTQPRKRGNSTIAEVSRKILKLAEKRIASENEMAQKRLAIDGMNAQNMA